MCSLALQVTETSLRGRLILMVNLMLMVGSLVSYSLGPLLSYRALALVPFLTALAALALNRLWMRETPFYLVSSGRADQALASLRALRVGKKDEEVRRTAWIPGSRL